MPLLKFQRLLLKTSLVISISSLLSGAAIALLNGKASTADDGIRAITAAIETPEGLCTGTVIGRELILTAAHCVAQKGRYRVHFLDKSFKPHRATVLRVAHHPKFDVNDGFSTDDIGLIQISPLPNFMKTAKLPHWFNFSNEGEEVTIAGFGATEKKAIKDGILREAGMTAVPPSINKSSFAGLVSINEAKVGMCVGDSGGPVFKMPSQTVIGVLKGGTTEPDKSCTLRPIFTPVRAYNSWIKLVADKWGVTIGE